MEVVSDFVAGDSFSASAVSFFLSSRHTAMDIAKVATVASTNHMAMDLSSSAVGVVP